MAAGRMVFWLLALAATVAASLMDFERPSTQATPTPSAARPIAPATASDPGLVREPATQRFGSAGGNLFATRVWQPPPAPAAAQAEPPSAPAPVAPALPFRYLGQRVDNGVITLFVGQGERTHLVREGDVLPNYRVERIAAGQATFIYLPLNQTQRLNFGAPS